MDAITVLKSIAAFAAANDIVTAPRRMKDSDALTELLELTSTETIHLIVSVGYPDTDGSFL
jgi:hypothetical protein